MTTIIHRSALPMPPNVAYEIVDGPQRHFVTWAEVMRARHEYQARRLADKRATRPMRVWRLSVEYFNQRLMGGWQAMFDSLNDSVWIDRDLKWLKEPLMELMPSALPGMQVWYEWKIEFAKRFKRGTRDGKPRGVAFLWWDGRDQLRRA